MATYRAKLGVSNHREAPHVVAVEPWGDDFTLMPGEELEILAHGESAVPRFHVVEWEGASQIYCEDTDGFEVIQGGILLTCGHKRQ